MRINQPIPDINTDNKNIYIPANAEPEKKIRKKPKTRLPDNYEYSDTHKDIAQKLNIDVDRALEDFKDHALANDRICNDWNAAFRNWIRKANDFKPQEQKIIHQDKNAKVYSNELRSTVQEYGPGHPHWEMINNIEKGNYNAKPQGSGTQKLSQERLNQNRNQTDNRTVYPSMRKASEYLP